MKEIELCHWLLQEPSGNCRSVFAPAGDLLENYRRVGATASSSQFVMPLCFAVDESLRSPVSLQEAEQICLKFVISRDDTGYQGSAFSGMEGTKVATLLSELSTAVAAWVESVGNRFQAIKLPEQGSEPIELLFQLKDSGPYSLERSLHLTKAGIEMMAYARGLKIGEWQVIRSQ